MSRNEQPRFPLYIPSKGRHEYLMTSRALTSMGVQHNIVVEPQEVDAYQRAIAALGLLTRVIPLDLSFKSSYELCDDLGLSRSTGPGPARNFAWEHSRSEGHEWHWVMDDNIRGFFRLNQNLKTPTLATSLWAAMEEFTTRYSNVAMSGPQYFMFAPRKTVLPPFVLNTRIYSCNLIRNDVGFRWRGRYNEDTILSLDLLKAGWCTIQFNAFLQDKMATQSMRGGNTAEFYLAEGKKKEKAAYATGGTDAKSEMLARVHPDVARVVWKFRRVHHEVDYTPFKSRQLVRRDGVEIAKEPDEFGMKRITHSGELGTRFIQHGPGLQSFAKGGKSQPAAPTGEPK